MTAKLHEALEALQASLPNGFDGCINFEITDLGWLFVNPSGVRIGTGAADLVLRADSETFAAIISGQKDPVHLYFTGRLQIEGDLNLAMRLGRQL